MDLKDLLALTSAGFTKNDIMSFIQPAAQSAPPVSVNPPPPAPYAVPAVTYNVPATAAPNTLDTRLAELTQAVRQGNILAAQQPYQAPENGSDILAKIINPPIPPTNNPLGGK